MPVTPDDLLKGLAARRDVHHAVIAVESEDGTLQWTGAAGLAQPGGAPMSPGTPFYIASIDKLLTASVIMLLQEAGQLSIDDPLGAVLPAGTVAGLHVLRGVDHTSVVTTRHLLSHTSGLADYLEDAPRGGRSWVEDLVRHGDRSWTDADALEHVRTALRPHFPPQPQDAPRVRIRYSDTNYLLLKLIIEAVASRPLPDVFADMLFRPAGMTRTWFAGRPAPPDAPDPAALWHDDRVLDIRQALQSLNGIYSTTGDLVAFMRRFVAGDLFQNPRTPALMQARWRRFGLPFDRAALRAPSWPIEYGLGIKRFRLPRAFTPREPMPAVYGHTGSTGTWLFHCPERHLYLCGAVDQVTAGAVPYRLMPKLLSAVPYW